MPMDIAFTVGDGTHLTRATPPRRASVGAAILSANEGVSLTGFLDHCNSKLPIYLDPMCI